MWKRYRSIENGAGVGKFCSVKSQIVNILGFMAHMVSVITTQPSYCSMKAAIGNMWLGANKTIFTKPDSRPDFTHVLYSLPTSRIE